MGLKTDLLEQYAVRDPDAQNNRMNDVTFAWSIDKNLFA